MEPLRVVAVETPRSDRLVLVAIDAAGAGGARAYTYHVPERLADLRPGEAVLVGFGSRQALGVVLDEAEAPPGVETRPIVDRVRADGPLLPPLALAFARWIALFGAMLTGYGLVSGDAIYARSLGVNVNLWWGLVLLAFGLTMLAFAMRAGGRRTGNG